MPFKAYYYPSSSYCLNYARRSKHESKIRSLASDFVSTHDLEIWMSGKFCSSSCEEEPKQTFHHVYFTN